MIYFLLDPSFDRGRLWSKIKMILSSVPALAEVEVCSIVLSLSFACPTTDETAVIFVFFSQSAQLQYIFVSFTIFFFICEFYNFQAVFFAEELKQSFLFGYPEHRLVSFFLWFWRFKRKTFFVLALLGPGHIKNAAISCSNCLQNWLASNGMNNEFL